MAADFYTTNKEENLINRIIKDGLENNDKIYKYHVLRLAIAKALRLEKLPLKSVAWDEKTLNGERDKKYDLEQITGKGSSDRGNDFDLLLRGLFYVRHKDEMARENINIFEDDVEYLKILSKYIKRGLYELENSYKSKDCFYQYCIENLFDGTLESSVARGSNLNFRERERTRGLANIDSQNKIYFPQIQHFFKKHAININLMNETPSYKHIICKVEVQDSTKIKAFESVAKYLDNELGCAVKIESCVGLSKAYNILIPKDTHEILGESEYKIGLESLKTKAYKLGIFAGMDIEGKPFCFDLVEARHLFVAGTTGSGKTTLMCVMIDTLLRQDSNKIIIIDPKCGTDYKAFSKKATMITDMSEASSTLDSLIEEMEERYAKQDFISKPYIIVFIDELNDLVMFDKSINAKLERLAIKARASKIHLVLGTQRPDAKVFGGQLRSNIPSRIALKVQKGSDSKIILDETGAEKLLGKGDMLVKLSDGTTPTPKHLFGVYLEFE